MSNILHNIYCNNCGKPNKRSTHLEGGKYEGVPTGRPLTQVRETECTGCGKTEVQHVKVCKELL